MVSLKTWQGAAVSLMILVDFNFFIELDET